MCNLCIICFRNQDANIKQSITGTKWHLDFLKIPYIISNYVQTLQLFYEKLAFIKF